MDLANLLTISRKDPNLSGNFHPSTAVTIKPRKQGKSKKPLLSSNGMANATSQTSSSNRPSTTVNMKGLLLIAESEVLSLSTSSTTLVWCNSGATHSRVFEELV